MELLTKHSDKLILAIPPVDAALPPPTLIAAIMLLTARELTQVFSLIKNTPLPLAHPKKMCAEIETSFSRRLLTLLLREPSPNLPSKTHATTWSRPSVVLHKLPSRLLPMLMRPKLSCHSLSGLQMELPTLVPPRSPVLPQTSKVSTSPHLMERDLHSYPRLSLKRPIHTNLREVPFHCLEPRTPPPLPLPLPPKGD